MNEIPSPIPNTLKERLVRDHIAERYPHAHSKEFRPRHIEIMQCLIDGAVGCEAIAESLGLTEKTIMVYREHTLNVLRNRGEEHVNMKRAIVVAIEEGRLDTTHVPSLEEHRLRKREVDVLGLLMQGYSGPEIAKTLWIVPKTVDSHVSNMKTRLGIKNQYQLVGMAAVWLQKQQESGKTKI